MGDLAVAYGFYGSAWDPEDSYTYDEVRLLGSDDLTNCEEYAN